MQNFSRLFIPLLVSYSLASISFTSVAQDNPQVLQKKYQDISALLKKNHYGVPIHIESHSTKDLQQGDIYGIIYHPFNTVKESLSKSVNWCDIAPQHLNIKACTYRKLNGSCQIRLYSGRKYFEYPEDAYLLEYVYSANIQRENFLRTSLLAQDGPLGTSNYKIITEAIPLDEKATFIHFSYSYNQGFWTRAAMGTYLATIGRDKVGFTIVSNDKNEQPVYIDGVRGVIERNAMRYYYAIQSYLDTLKQPLETRFLASLDRWFDLTETHHRQLYEMDKKDYLEYKKKERNEQMRLQKIIDSQQDNCPVPIDSKN